ncbi:MAG: lipid-transfer protein [Pseudomonadota bacterium]
MRRTAIAGIGTTRFSRDSGLTEQQLAVQAIMAAVADAGLDLASIDGIVKFTADSTKESTLVDVLGLPGIRFFAEVGYGGMATAGALAVANAAVASGQARCVVCYRAMNGRSGVRFGRGERMIREGGDDTAYADGERTFGSALTGPFGLLSPSQQMGMWAQRYAHVHGIGKDKLTRALAEVAIVQREYSRNNPNAVLGGKPLTLADYMDSRFIATPLRLPDFCIEIDGGAAIVVTAMDLAFDATRKPVEILAASQSLKPYGDTPALYTAELERHAPEAAREIFAMAGIQPADVDVAAFYDATSIMVPMMLEDLGFCGRGEAMDFVLEGGTRIGGALPVNTQGGMLSEGYLHGFNNALEVVRQMRGESVNQVPNAKVGLFSVGYGSVVLGVS